VIGRLFFPSTDTIASIAQAYGVFAVGYLMRPLGGLVFGHLRDRFGRKRNPSSVNRHDGAAKYPGWLLRNDRGALDTNKKYYVECAGCPAMVYLLSQPERWRP
jgi:hypothetical protein